MDSYIDYENEMFNRLVEIEGVGFADDLQDNGALDNMAKALERGAIVKVCRKGPMSFSVEVI